MRKHSARVVLPRLPIGANLAFRRQRPICSRARSFLGAACQVPRGAARFSKPVPAELRRRAARLAVLAVVPAVRQHSLSARHRERVQAQPGPTHERAR